jgi:hypothetical protein
MLPPRGANRVRDSRLKTLHGKLHSGLVGLLIVAFMGLAMSSVPVRGPGHLCWKPWRCGIHSCKASKMVANLSSHVITSKKVFQAVSSVIVYVMRCADAEAV